VKRVIERIRADLYKHFGPLGWWPADTPDQVAMGAILVQRTTWRQASAALGALEQQQCVRLPDILLLQGDKLEKLIRPAGFYRQKARYLRALSSAVMERGGNLVAWLSVGSLEERRSELLAVTGVGKETADSILLYAAARPIFVVDAYTRRMFRRHEIPLADAPYDRLRKTVEREVGMDVNRLGEFHAGIVEAGKQFCLAGSPRCESCPLGSLLFPFVVD